jgi:hypothetical protein
MMNNQNNQPSPADKDAQKTTQPNQPAKKDGEADGAKKNAPADLKGFAAIKAKEESLKAGASQQR